MVLDDPSSGMPHHFRNAILQPYSARCPNKTDSAGRSSTWAEEDSQTRSEHTTAVFPDLVDAGDDPRFNRSEASAIVAMGAGRKRFQHIDRQLPTSGL